MEASSFLITNKTRKINLFPIKSFSIYNDGNASIKIWFAGTGQHEIKANESLDFNFDNAIRTIYAVSNETATIRLVGTRTKFQNENSVQPVQLPAKPTIKSVQPQVIQQQDNTIFYIFGLITIITIVCVTAMVITKK